MYSGIGLPTPRGSGTSGYIQRNLGFLKPVRNDFGGGSSKNDLKQLSDFKTTPKVKINQELLEHSRKRAVESKIFVLTEALRERGLDEETIAGRVAAERKRLDDIDEAVNGGREGVLPRGMQNAEKMDSHQIAELKAKQVETFRGALQISSDHKFGEAFDPEEQEKKRIARLEAQKARLEKEREAQEAREKELKKAAETRRKEEKERRRKEKEERHAEKRRRRKEEEEKKKKKAKRKKYSSEGSSDEEQEQRRRKKRRKKENDTRRKRRRRSESSDEYIRQEADERRRHEGKGETEDERSDREGRGKV